MGSKEIRKLVSLTLIIMGIGVWIGLTYDNKPPIPYEKPLPPQPDLTREMYYDFTTESWRYLYRGEDDNYRKVKKFLEEHDMDEYLQKHVKHYKEDTYWGEEPSLTRDEGDDED